MDVQKRVAALAEEARLQVRRDRLALLSEIFSKVEGLISPDLNDLQVEIEEQIGRPGLVSEKCGSLILFAQQTKFLLDDVDHELERVNALICEMDEGEETR